MQNENSSACPDIDVNKDKCIIPVDGCKDPEPCAVKKTGDSSTVQNNDPCGPMQTGEKKAVPKPPKCPQVIGPCGSFNKPIKSKTTKPTGYKCNAKGDKFNPCAALSKTEGVYDDDDDDDYDDDDDD